MLGRRVSLQCHAARYRGAFWTHLDPPVHFIEGGKGVDELDINVLVGPCVVVEVTDAMDITPDYLAALNQPADTARLLLKTKYSALWEKPNHAFHKDFAALTTNAARWVVDRGIKVIGIDYLSIQLFTERTRPPTTCCSVRRRSSSRGRRSPRHQPRASTSSPAYP